MSVFVYAYEYRCMQITIILFYLHEYCISAGVYVFCVHSHAHMLWQNVPPLVHQCAQAGGRSQLAASQVFSVSSISQPTCFYSVDRFITICPMTSDSYFWDLWGSDSILKIPIMSLAPFVSKHLILINGRWRLDELR